MPYIITTRAYATSSLLPREPAPRIRRAVATLEEAHNAAREIVAKAYDYAYNADAHADAPGEGWLDYVTSDDPQSPFVPESGGTIGPLPDGTVIEVERLSWDELRTAIPQALEFDHGRRCEAILDAYNTAQGDA